MKTFAVSFFLFAPLCFGGATLFKQEGVPLEVRFDDGRVATLNIDKEKIFHLDAPFGLSENTCNDHLPTKCLFRSAIRLDRLAMIWNKHPTPEQQGKIVTYPEGEKASVVVGVQFRNSVAKYMNQKSVADFPEDTMECEDFRWLPTQTTEAPDRLTITRWDSEAMFTNPETGINENRILGGGINLQLERGSLNQLLLKTVDRFTGPIPGLFQGDILALILPLSESEYCQISVKPNFSKTQAALVSYFTEIKDDFTPYIWGSDENSLSLDATVASYIQAVTGVKP